MEFSDVIRARRSCRKYTPDSVPAKVMNKALDDALLAPNSSNMQLWDFFWVSSPEKKSELSAACLGQSAAATAQEMVVVVANWSKWREHRRLMIQELEKNNARPASIRYYEKLIPIVYSYGPLSLFGALKALLVNLLGLFRPTPRGPNTRGDVAMVAVKSAALACENFMLSICDQGFGCCPMEGFDEVRVRRILGLRGCSQRVVMVISVGKVDSAGIYGPQIRFERARFIKKL